MKKGLGSFLVLFRPGVAAGIHNEREVVLRYICDRLGEFDCKVFDPYMAYSFLADAGLLLRIEQRNIYGCSAVAFFYPDAGSEHQVRRKIINKFLDEVKNDPKLLRNGYAVVSDRRGNLKLWRSGRLRLGPEGIGDAASVSMPSKNSAGTSTVSPCSFPTPLPGKN